MIFAHNTVRFGGADRLAVLDGRWLWGFLWLAVASFSVPIAGLGAELAGPDSSSGKVPIAAKIVRYARRMIVKYERNGDGQLEPEEWRQMGGDAGAADANGDRLITVEEFSQYVANYSLRRKIRLRSPGPEIQFVFPLLQNHNDAVSLRQQETVPVQPPPAKPPRKPRFYVRPSELPEGLPKWFVDRDTDGDAQVSLHEFTAGTPRADMNLFNRSDANGDGLLTPRECIDAMKTQPTQEPKDVESTGPSGAGSGSKSSR